MRVLKDTDSLHPIMVIVNKKIQKDIIEVYNAPFRLFETGRTHDRHDMLLKKGKTKYPISRHLFNLDNTPPLYSTALDFVYYDGKWSWNLRDSTIKAWYVLFGNMVLDICPELEWSGFDRKGTNYCHFQLKEAIIINNLDRIPCVIP